MDPGSEYHEGHKEHEGCSFSIVKQLTYMKLISIKTDLLIKFNLSKLKDGIKRYVL